MHHHGAGEIVEGRAELQLQPFLQAEIAVPHQAFEKRVHEGHDQRRGAQLRTEPGTLGDAAGDDRRDCRGEGQQEEELHQRIATVHGQRRRRMEESHAVGNPVADEEIGQRRDGEVGQNLRQGVDLVLQAHGAHLEEGEAGVHRQHHHRSEQDEQGIGAVDQDLHRTIQVIHGLRQPSRVERKHQKRPRPPFNAP
ncbi:hypothetical protein PAERUG_E6_London_17_VIM_2_12_12_05731 [Pseudomonas aeruginosa]|nr:hypothetical protein PAERUG_E6_London_17_VIM_2_12_12_05731 [Pseudomonas aeruginosa]CRR40181.1 hypothetical protein PAERUG_E16_London_17_VIM_2_04_14_05264 [Pseudomonas aeruginosa]CRX25345.1 hypothetical protein PAERUG_P54_1_London_24_VIM_2_04_13_04171 [Pseudomonas aeruginosa]